MACFPAGVVAERLRHLAADAEPATGGALSRTVYAPTGEDVSGTLVVACYFVNNTRDETRSKAQTLTATGFSSSFALNNLDAFIFVLVAAKDTASDGAFTDAGGLCVGLDGMTPPKPGLALRLAVVGGTPPSEAEPFTV